VLDFLNDGLPLCDDVSRRTCLKVGSLGLGGLSLPHLLAQRADANERPRAKAKNVILFWLTGGVPQHDTWDPKPNGPDSARTPFGVIPTTTPGLHIGGLMPKTAQLTHHMAVIRSMSTGDNSHSSSGYQMLTGVPHIPLSRENALPEAPNDWPSLDALVRTQIQNKQGLPSSITLPRHIANVGEKVWPGQDAGFLGRQYDPWLLDCDPSAENFQIPALALPEQISQVRLDRRLGLLKQVDQHLNKLEQHASAQRYDLRTSQAIELLAGQSARTAFDLSKEPDKVRDRYGRTKFGQSILLSRRLIEAGASLVHVNWQRIEGKENNGGWDTHKKHNESLEGWLMPIMDQSFSALIEDLEQRGMLDETLVAWVGEFGHTPKINARAGRDHWGRAFSIALAGGGIKGGTVIGATEKQAGTVVEDLVRPADYIATVLHCLGISPETIIHDAQGRPNPLSRGKVIDEIVA
jgi:hypothetical protein